MADAKNDFQYRKTYPYCLSQDAYFALSRPLANQVVVDHPYFVIAAGDGPAIVQVKAHYAWDGPSGPTLDTDNSLRASLLHDALYQAMREKLLPARRNRRLADREFRLVLARDGMFFLRRWLWWIAVRLFAAHAARPRKRT